MRMSAAKLVMNLLRKGIAPIQILTRPAFDNAIAAVAATGGSTNAVLHLLAIAREAGVPLHIDDFQRVSERTPAAGRSETFGPLCSRRHASSRWRSSSC